jgi:hypothetical protein
MFWQRDGMLGDDDRCLLAHVMQWAIQPIRDLS